MLVISRTAHAPSVSGRRENEILLTVASGFIYKYRGGSTASSDRETQRAALFAWFRIGICIRFYLYEEGNLNAIPEMSRDSSDDAYVALPVSRNRQSCPPRGTIKQRR